VVLWGQVVPSLQGPLTIPTLATATGVVEAATASASHQQHRRNRSMMQPTHRRGACLPVHLDGNQATLARTFIRGVKIRPPFSIAEPRQPRLGARA
jgi:hypothetical protein